MNPEVTQVTEYIFPSVTKPFLPQVNPDKYKSIGNGFAVTVREDGVRGLAKGWAPTFIGYSMQGLCKFGFYEVFKIMYSDLLGEVSAHAMALGEIWTSSSYGRIPEHIYSDNRKILVYMIHFRN